MNLLIGTAVIVAGGGAVDAAFSYFRFRQEAYDAYEKLTGIDLKRDKDGKLSRCLGLIAFWIAFPYIVYMLVISLASG